MANLKLDDLLPRLENVRRVGNGFTSHCPSHDDRKNSLSITEAAGGNVLLYCHAGCQFQKIVRDLGVPTNGNGNHRQQQIREIYDYTDEVGNLLFQAVRFEPKDFRQRRPDGNGGWIWNLQNVQLVLYRLPEVLASELIYLVEGEKDVETLRSLDLPATCNPMGAGKWRSEYSESLRGKTVIILPDNDKVGREHAEKVANALSGIANEIVIVDLPDLPEKGDVTDYFRNGGTVDELIDLAARAESWQPGSEAIKEIGAENTDAEVPNLFVVKSANEWLMDAMQRPIPKMLFGEFWFEGELCILFADTNLGKSIMAVQIAESIARGEGIGFFPLTAEKQKVLYMDFELSDKQFETRYSETRAGSDYSTNHYQFSENFLRAEVNPEGEVPNNFQTFEDYLNFSLQQLLVETESKILVVDNITYLRSETERAKDALPLMKELKRLKKKHELSILALAHTPKRDLSKPVTRNDLQGSKMLMNFCDSSFAIGESHKDKDLRYLKQIKERNTSKIYDAENVCVCQVEKPENFLQFHFLRFGDEAEHLKRMSEKDREGVIEMAKNLATQGRTQREIARELNLSVGTINKYLKI